MTHWTKTTKYGINPLIPHKDHRPRCSSEGCQSPKAIIGCRKDGSPKYRDVCQYHHDKRTAAKHGLNTISEITALAFLGMIISSCLLESIG